jgi:hypothetical protein
MSQKYNRVPKKSTFLSDLYPNFLRPLVDDHHDLMPNHLTKLGGKNKKTPGSSLSSAQFLVGFCVGACLSKKEEGALISCQ